MERHNRKSHLAPQLSPSTQALLRSSDSPTRLETSPDSSGTPTSGEIMIAGLEGHGRHAVPSPRDHTIDILNGVRSPNNNVQSLGRSSGRSVQASSSSSQHPGLPRMQTTGSVPKSTTLNLPEGNNPGGSTSANQMAFMHNLPIRPAPPTSALPPPPPSRRDAEERSTRRQALNFALPLGK